MEQVPIVITCLISFREIVYNELSINTMFSSCPNITVAYCVGALRETWCAVHVLSMT